MRIGRTGRRNRGSIFLLAMIALISLVILGVSLMEIAVNGLNQASKDQKRAQAFSLAESGVDMALAMLYDDYGGINEALETTGTYSSSFSLPQGDVDFTVTAPYNGITNTCLVMSHSQTWANKEETIRVIATYVDDPSRAFKGAIFSDSPLTIGGNVTVLPDEGGEGAQIYSNGDITLKGGSVSFNDPTGTLPQDVGYVYTTGTINEIPEGCPQTNVYEHIAPIPMPVIDLNYYQSIATHTFDAPHSGLNWTTADMVGLSGVVYINGDIKLAGSFEGQFLLVASGQITVVGNVTTTTPETSSIALMSPKAIRITGGSEIDGLIYAHGVEVDATVTGTGNVTVHGAICADVVTAAKGSITVQYTDVWTGLPLPGTGKSQWAQISWEELFL